jgi:hypothetical protein
MINEAKVIGVYKLKRKILNSTIFCWLAFSVSLAVAQPSIKSMSWGQFEAMRGEASEGAILVLEECKKRNDYFQSAALLSDNFTIFGRQRFFECAFFSDPSELKRPSSIEQRIMQTRKFNKPPSEITKALNSLVYERGLMGHIDTTTNRGSIYFKTKDFVNLVLGVGVSISPTSTDASVVRISTSYVNVRSMSAYESFFSEKMYQRIFNEIAQQLFTQAIVIDIDPIEMR